MEYVVRRLQSAAADPEMRYQMNVEDEYFRELEDRDTAIMERDRRLKEQGARLKEQAARLEEQGVKLEEQDVQLKEQSEMLRVMIGSLKESGKSIQEIAGILGKSEEDILLILS